MSGARNGLSAHKLAHKKIRNYNFGAQKCKIEIVWAGARVDKRKWKNKIWQVKFSTAIGEWLNEWLVRTTVRLSVDYWIDTL
jgi:hypothetical protein